MSISKEITRMIADFEAGNGFPPDRVVMTEAQMRELFGELRWAAGRNFMGATIEIGPKLQCRAARLVLEIAAR